MMATVGYVDETVKRVEEGSGSGEHSIIETLQSLLIAFIFAFVFRGFVVEAFVIPTGSMAPTLRGGHLIAHGKDSGYVWPIDTVDKDASNQSARTQRRVDVRDPMLHSSSGSKVGLTKRNGPRLTQFINARSRMGDRILVLKYLYLLMEPMRFDVIVFKNPTNPSENYIKRLIGLPNETLWLADGDVFARPVSAESSTSGGHSFMIQRKPEHVQRNVWQPVYYSEFIPIHKETRWTAPWAGANWTTESRRSYVLNTASKSALVYQNRIKPLLDFVSYNDSGNRHSATFPVSDIRLAGNVRPEKDGLRSTIRITCREHIFEAVLTGTQAILRMRPDREGSAWTILATESIKTFAPANAITNIEFWHVDQALWLWVEGKRVAYADYPESWDAKQRLIHATGLNPDTITGETGNEYTKPQNYPDEPYLEWEFQGSPLTLHRLELDRDIYYRPVNYNLSGFRGRPGLATHPTSLPTFGPDQFFACGDNSAASLDGRLWGAPTPWISRQFDGTRGIVPRDLLIGKAFHVYFPSPEGLTEKGMRFVPNFGEIRFIH